MERFIKFIIKYKICVFILVVLIVFLIPIIINESYKVGRGYITMWGAADVLSFYGSFLSFIGSIILGIVAIWQNNKAYKLNEQLQKLQQAEYISMVSVKRVIVERENSSNLNLMNKQNSQIDIIDMTKDGFSSDEFYYIDAEIKNDSKYPIVQMQIHPSDIKNANGLFYGMKNLVDQAIYIPSGESTCFRYIVPCKIFDYVNTYELRFSFNFINIFDHGTPANLYISDLTKNGNCTEYKYRLFKFIDVRPKD